VELVNEVICVTQGEGENGFSEHTRPDVHSPYLQNTTIIKD